VEGVYVYYTISRCKRGYSITTCYGRDCNTTSSYALRCCGRGYDITNYVMAREAKQHVMLARQALGLGAPLSRWTLDRDLIVSVQFFYPIRSECRQLASWHDFKPYTYHFSLQPLL
jgi:hypothetical protein